MVARWKTIRNAVVAAFLAASLVPSALFAQPMLEAGAVVTAAKAVPECREAQKQPVDSEIRKACERLERHIQWLEARLKAVCTDAAERIARTVSDVEGLYVKPPSRNPNESFGRFHEDDRLYTSWISPGMGRRYSLCEMDSFRTPGKIDQRRQEILPQGKRRAQVKEHYQQLDQPSAKYGVSWRRVGEKVDLARGLYGDETFVFEVASGEVLAVRRAYYYELSPYAVDETGRTLVSPHWRSGFRRLTKTCENYRPKEDLVRRDRQPGDSYEFVSRVLRPKQISDEAAVGIFDLALGSGEKEGGCMVASFGPRIGPEDVELVRIGDYGLRITIKGTGDFLYCERFYRPDGHAKSALYRFYDSTSWTFEDIDRRANQRAHVLAATEAAPGAPAAAPAAPEAGTADQGQGRRDPQCDSVPTKKERIARLQGRDPRAMEREGYPSDPNVVYQKAKEIGNMRDAWGAIIMVQEGVRTRRDLNRADELWKDYWCSQVLPAFEDRPQIAFETLKAAAGRGLPSAMIRLSEVYARGEFGQSVQQRLSVEWKNKHDATRAAKN